MAITEKWLAARYNRPDFEIFDYNIYAVCGDGCMMEGIEVRLAKRSYGWPEDARFLVPDGVYEHFAAGIGHRPSTPRTASEKPCLLNRKCVFP